MMSRIIFTDLRRGQRKFSYILLMGIVILLIILLAVISFIFPGEGGKAARFESLFTVIEVFIPFLVGIPVYQAVITDDFKSRTMQTAIGRGISRQNLILARFFEIILMLVEAFIVFSIVGAITGLVLGMSGSSISIMVIKMWSSSFLIFAHLSIAMFLAFLALNPTVGLVFYILFETNVFRLIFSLLDGISFFKDNGIAISEWIPSGLNSNFTQYTFGVERQEVLGTIIDAVPQDIGKGLLYGLALVGIYCILPLVLSQVVFRKKELDF